MKRKIVQIAASGAGESGGTGWYPALYALADDGTLWRMSRGDGNWWIVKSLPKDCEECAK